jgi:hypothetical protein
MTISHRVSLSSVPFAILACWNAMDLDTQHVSVKLCLILAKSFTETFQMLKINRRSGWENRRREQKSTSESITCEGVDLFLWEGCRSSWVYSTWSDRQLTVLFEGYEVFEGGRAKEETWGMEKQDRDVAPWAPAQTSLLVLEFLAKHEMTVVPGRPTIQIWPL